MREPRIFTIPAGTPFLPTLADALLDGTLTGDVPDSRDLADATIYLPTRRAGRALGTLLADRMGRRVLALPRIVPLGDVLDERGEADPALPGPPPIAMGERRLILAKLVQAWTKAADRSVGPPGSVPIAPPGSPADAVALAGDLAALMDSLATEGVPWEALAEAVEQDFSRYFALTLAFVRIAHESWPRILAERGGSDPARTRHEALLREAERLAAAPPPGLVIAAGSTGSVPATARLLAAISRLPRGAVVLPGLDQDLDEDSFAAIGGRPGGQNLEAGPLWGHPQCMMRRFLAGPLAAERAAVRALGPEHGPDHPAAARRRLVSEALRPADSTDRWAEIPSGERLRMAAAGQEGLALIEAADEREEALAVAIALRETLAVPGRTAALVTPDRGLARRVAVELARWGVAVEDSAGTALSDTAAGRLARLAAEAAAASFEPVATLALLAHPAVTLGLARTAVENAAASLEIAVLRGPAPARGLAGIAAALGLRRAGRGPRDPLPRQGLTDADWDAAEDLVGRLAAAFADFARDGSRDALDLTGLAARHADAVAALTEPSPGEAPPEDAPTAALLALFDELALMPEEAALVGRFGDYPAFFTALARDRALAPEPSRTHRRVKILGLLEARLLHVDRAVLGGLDESIWPPGPENDAFLNRPMRLTLGLSPPERRIGQTAHDFAQALGMPDVVLSRARKRDGKPTVPSRFLERLRSFMGAPLWDGLRARGRRYRDLAEALDRPRRVAPLARPCPRPGAWRFPRSLSVTEIETLVRDPYGIYARHILRLTPLDRVGAEPSLAERGSILHAILADFAGAHPGALPARADQDLVQRGLDGFAPVALAYPELHALWWPDFLRIVPRYLDWEAARRARCPDRQLERRGRLEIALADGTVLAIRGVADRIEQDGAGGAAIIDFKSGRVPTDKEVALGFSPQMTLEAAMLMEGGFRDVPAADELPALHYVKLGGQTRLHDHELKPPKTDTRTLAAIVDAHLRGVAALARRYGEDGAGYLSRPFPRFLRSHSPYDHLARVKEWSVVEDAAGESS